MFKETEETTDTSDNLASIGIHHCSITNDVDGNRDVERLKFVLRDFLVHFHNGVKGKREWLSRRKAIFTDDDEMRGEMFMVVGPIFEEDEVIAG